MTSVLYQDLLLRSERYGRGCVRDQWNRIDGLGEGAVGKWTQPAPGIRTSEILREELVRVRSRGYV